MPIICTRSVTVLKFKISYNQIWCHIWTAKIQTNFLTKAFCLKKKKGNYFWLWQQKWFVLACAVSWNVCIKKSCIIVEVWWKEQYVELRGEFWILYFTEEEKQNERRVAGLLERWMISNLSHDSTLNTQDLFHGGI